MINSINKVSSWTKDGNNYIVDTSNTALIVSNLVLDDSINCSYLYDNLIKIECDGRTYICDSRELITAIDNSLVYRRPYERGRANRHYEPIE